ncbi:DUF2931 family protein [Porphyromonas macacae]|uniref:DUF2931 family protein n=1 Tax=Porphyromonas macacae TaxID=28115 RepID=UPI00359FF48E
MKLRKMAILFTLSGCISLMIAGVFKGTKHSKEKYMYKEYHWRTEVKVPAGYPVSILGGSFYAEGLRKGKGMIEEIGTGGIGVTEEHEATFPHWYTGSGSPGFSSTSKAKLPPQNIMISWLSYVEGCEYELKETDIDQKRINTLFEEGFMYPGTLKSSPQRDGYDAIQVGLAPGGVVILWVAGSGRSVEVGRYQAERKDVEFVPKDSLNGRSVLYSTVWRDNVLKRTKPKDDSVSILPVPYGVWDKYRVRYCWKAVLKTKDKHKYIRSILYEYYNGEEETLFGERIWRENQIEKYHIPPHLQYDYLTGRAIPHEMVLSWYDENDVRYHVALVFDETEVFNAFAKAFSGQENIAGELIVEVSKSKSDASILLVAGERKVWITDAEVEVYESGYQEQ